MRTVSIGNMVKSLSGMIGTNDLTAWEQSFVQSVADKSNQGKDTSNLSEKQVEKIDAIYRSHFA